MTLPPTPATRGQPTRQALTYLSFAVAYFLLAAFAASMPMHARAALLIWPAHGLALGVLLVAPVRRWPAYLAIVFVDSLLAGWPLGTPWPGLAAAAAINVAHPLVVAAGLLKLAGPQVEIGTLRGLAAFLVGMVPLVAAMAAYWVGFCLVC